MSIRRAVQFWAILVVWGLFTVTLLLPKAADGSDYTAASPRSLAAALGSGKARTDAINASYLQAFGRYPTRDELNYWSSLPSSDGRIQSLDTLIANHRAWLKSNAQEREAAVQRAFSNIYGHGATAKQQTWYQSALSQAAQGSTYHEVRRYLAGTYVDVAYQQLLKRNPEPAGRAGWVEKMTSQGWGHERVWTAIAQSEERISNFGYWAPARTTYSGKVETCFGAIGPKCEGAPRNTPKWTDTFVRPDGTEMGYVNIAVSVGSILHDNACLRAGVGTMCNGLPKGLTIDSLPLVNYLQAASLEWNKAAWNTYDGRFWTERFGPYPLNEAERRDSWSDDLTKTDNRPSKMAPIFTGMPAVVGLGSWPAPSVDFKHGETRQTKALKAPKGTAVDRGDAKFCQSESYTEDGNFWVAKWWGICR